MSAQLRRIGKSLIQFFKPVRVALPHDVPRMPSTGVSAALSLEDFESSDHKADARIVPLKPPVGSFERAKPEVVDATSLEPDVVLRGASQGAAAPTLAPKLAPLPPALDKKQVTHWLNLVGHLLAVCRKLTSSMDHRRGLQSYQQAVRSRGQHKMKSVVGSIIDTMPAPETTDAAETADARSGDVVSVGQTVQKRVA